MSDARWRINYYDRQGRPIRDVMQWSRLLEDDDYKRVAFTEVGPCEVSTVWLGINYNWTRQGAPLIFETMIFDNRHDAVECWRYPTEEAALAGHDQAVMWARERATA